ncbi:MAG: hypothetical protein HYY17_05105 [Planctomycetes bacterium]|nr:hypothetical protein [Planctomycetota bacterium]
METLLALALAQIVVDHRCVDEQDRAIPQEWLDRGRKLRVLFGHQSVGGNVIEGLAALAESKPARYAIEVGSGVEPAWFDEHSGLLDFEVGENENPRGKIDHFRRKLSKEGFGKKADVATMKLCWVDFGESETEAKAVFERHRETMASLAKEFPKVRLVWWTAPLADGGNRGRHAYNRLVREHCRARDAVLFDLADIESHDPQGKEHLEDGVPAIQPKYTEDGGHLNGTAQGRVARAFWWLLARIAGWSGK